MSIQALYERFDAMPTQADVLRYLLGMAPIDKDALCAAAVEGRTQFHRVNQARFNTEGMCTDNSGKERR